MVALAVAAAGVAPVKNAGNQSGEVTELLEAPDTRTARVPSAPGRGLVLWRVWYK